MSTETYYCPRCHRGLVWAKDRNGVPACPNCGEPATRTQPGVMAVIGFALPLTKRVTPVLVEHFCLASGAHPWSDHLSTERVA